MFNTTDLAALPTNIALTLWDALPIILAIGASLAILAATILPNNLASFWFHRRKLLAIEGTIYVGLLSPLTAILLVAMTLIGIVVDRGVRPASRRPSVVFHRSPADALRQHLGDLFGHTLVAAALLGVYEIMLRPSVELNELVWALLLAILVGVFGLLPSAAAIIVLAFTSAGDPTIAALVIMIGSVSGIVARRYFESREIEPSEPIGSEAK